MPLPRRFRSFALCLALLAAGGAVQAASAQEIERLYRSGRQAEAWQQLDAALSAAPRDVQMRFLKGVLLTEAGRRSEAAELYQRLTQEYPDLPEPYNNLAVLYAADGKFEQAREALQTALRNDPSYTTARENLGDVYLQLALQAYDQAAPRSAAAQRKLQLARQVLARPTRGS